MPSLPLRVCIATWELKNFTPGGIGVLVHNLLKEYGSDPRLQLSILWYGPKKLTSSIFTSFFPNCQFYRVNDWCSRPADEDILYPDSDAFYTERHRTSFQLMTALRALETKTGPFDVIEFPDFAGAAFATIQEKLLRRAFLRTTIAVRLHSTEAVLRPRDHRPPNAENSFVADMERKALADADVVVGHLSPIIDDVQTHFAFSGGWQRKTFVELPPVLTDLVKTNDAQTSFNARTPLLFTSKVQWIKRAHVFINAAVAFMNAEPDFEGEALLIAHVINDELRRHCLDLIPDNLKDRIRIVEDLSNNIREQLISRSISIFPTAYESFCLAAYEANYLGAGVILNGNNPAFGSDTPWKDEINCWKFDGTASDLFNTLLKMWANRRTLVSERVQLPRIETPYWLKTSRGNEPRSIENFSKPGLSLIILTSDEFGDPLETIRSALLIEEIDIEIIIASDMTPSAPEISSQLARIQSSRLCSDGIVKFVQLGFRGGIAALCNLGIRSAKHDILAFARAGAAFDGAFLLDGEAALRNSEYDIVIPQVVYEQSTPDQENRFFSKAKIGEAPNSGLGENLLGELEMIVRRSTALSVGFDEALDRYVDWDFHMRACLLGHRSIVSNRVEARIGLLNTSNSVFFRSHFDAVLAKHVAKFSDSAVNLVSALDSPESRPDTDWNSFLFSKRPLAYYVAESRPWTKIAWRNPTKLLRWLMVREVQRNRARKKAG